LVDEIENRPVVKCSFRLVGNQSEQLLLKPEYSQVTELLFKIETGVVDSVKLFTQGDACLWFLGRPGFVFICLFVSDEEEYIFDDGTGDTTKIEIAGDYWSSFTLCKSQNTVEQIAREFYFHGQLLASKKWNHYVSNDD